MYKAWLVQVPSEKVRNREISYEYHHPCNWNKVIHGFHGWVIDAVKMLLAV